MKHSCSEVNHKNQQYDSVLHRINSIVESIPPGKLVERLTPDRVACGFPLQWWVASALRICPSKKYALQVKICCRFLQRIMVV